MANYFLFNKMSDYCFKFSIIIKNHFSLIKMLEFDNHFNLLNSFENEFNHFNWVYFQNS